MTTPAWPGTVPLEFPIDVASYSGPSAEIVETEMQDGPARRRLATVESWTLTPMRLRLSATELQAFWTFYATTTAHGASPFTATVHRPWGCATKTCRFSGPRPSMTPQGSFTLVSFAMAIRDYHD
jgi:hypothetical protein